ncbi:MAG: nucleotidyltransferase domain-containing protein [Maribacter sp.]
MKEIDKHIEQIKKLCDSNGVKSLFAFGSVLQDWLRVDSDIDLLVDIDDRDPLSYADKYFDLKFNLEKIFNRKIDLLELRAVRNRFLKEEIDRTKFQIYGE